MHLPSGRRLASTLLTAAIFAALGVPAAAADAKPTLRALLIGINEYEALPDLRGALNDLDLVEGVLTTRFGFPKENITVMRDAEASRDGILDAFAALAEASGPEDIVYIHYSGHGSQATDMNGDEDDGFDETLVPANGRTGDITDITDDELAQAFAKFQTPNLVVVLDSCHSGTATRSAAVQARAIPRDQRTNLYEGVATRAVVPLVTGRLILLTGAASEEQALDGPVDGRSHGLFSYAFAKSLSNAPADVTPRAVLGGVEKELERIKAQLGLRNMPEPQLEATPDRLEGALLGRTSKPAAASAPTETAVQDSARLPWLEARRTGPGEVRLVAGVAAGALPGAIWAIYPAAEEAFEPGRAIAEATVTGTDGADAIARYEPPKAALPSGARAVEVSPPTPSDAVEVLLVSEDAARKQRLEQAIAQQIPVVHFVGESDFARFRVELDGGEAIVTAADGVSEVARFDASDDAKLATQLGGLFARSMTASELLALENTATRMKLALHVGSTERADAPSEASEPLRGMVIAETSASVYRIRKAGDPRSLSNSLQLSVTPSDDCHLTVIDVDSEGNLLQLFPNAISESRGYLPGGKLRGGETVRIPDSLESGNRAGFYVDYAPPVGTDTVRAFCTADAGLAGDLRTAIASLSASTGTRSAERESVRNVLSGSVRQTLGSAMSRGVRLVADEPEAQVADAGAAPAAEPAKPLVLPDWVATSLTLEILE